jgi:hypothetical protein
MSQYAQYASTVANGAVTISAANTNRDGSGSITDIITGAANGTRIDDVQITAQGTTTNGMIRLFIYNGTTSFLFREINVYATIPGAVTPTWNQQLTDLMLVLKTGWKLRASTQNAEAFNILVTRAGDF